jgi:ABC-type multidrug transport system fused ATPase/permease subunit
MFYQSLILLSELWAHLTRVRKAQFIFVLILSLFSALLEMVGLGILFPFLGAIMATEQVMQNSNVSLLISIFRINTGDEFIFLLWSLLVSTALLASILKVVLVWIGSRVSYAAAGDLNVAVFGRSLAQPYEVHISRNSSEVIAGINSKVSQAMLFLHQSVLLVSSCFTLASVSITLLLIDTFTTSITFLVFSVAYVLVFLTAKNRLKSNGLVFSREVTVTLKILRQSFDGIREVLLKGSANYLTESYRRSDSLIRESQANHMLITSAPKHVIEGLGIIFIATLAVWLSSESEGVERAIPILGVLALGAQRLLPALQQIFSSTSNIVSAIPSVGDAVRLLNQVDFSKAVHPSGKFLPFENSIVLANVSFHYPEHSHYALKGINLVIKKGERIGIIGQTGSGKSSLLDILSGLVMPIDGGVTVDKRDLNKKNVALWRQKIGYVSQNPIIFDISVAENVAWGLDFSEINLRRVSEVCQIAQISELIESRPLGYKEILGEFGVSLSGGQRQRLALARALYANPEILILDEATSALDVSTEREITKALSGMDRHLTMLIVAHRYSSIEFCDRVIELRDGLIIKDQSYARFSDERDSSRD